MYTVLNYIQPFEGNCEADVAPGENEFDTLDVTKMKNDFDGLMRRLNLTEEGT